MTQLTPRQVAITRMREQTETLVSEFLRPVPTGVLLSEVQASVGGDPRLIYSFKLSDIETMLDCLILQEIDRRQGVQGSEIV